MYLIALTGGIGAGKSTIARLLAEFGAHVIDADRVARDVVEPGQPALIELVKQFGDEIVTATGSLNRAKLAQIVFNNPTRLRELNAIVHPAVQKAVLEKMRAFHSDDIVVYDVPLLVEAQRYLPFDLVVVASAPEDVRRARLIELRGMTETEADSRIASQVSEAERLALADVVIDTSGSLEETVAQVERLWERIQLVD
jgi:dephospho-CoA kinase